MLSSSSLTGCDVIR